MRLVTRRWRSRILSHHLPAAAISAVVAGTLFMVTDGELVQRMSMATAYASLLLLAATLTIGPWRVLRNRPSPVSTDVRRDLAIWAAVLGTAHVVVGLQVHLKSPLKYFFRSREAMPWPRLDLFGLANYTGLVATVILVILLMLSNDASLRYFGSQRWKRLQRWSYAMSALVLLHAVAYQLIEKRTWPLAVVLAAVSMVVLWLQLRGRTTFLTRLRARGA